MISFLACFCMLGIFFLLSHRLPAFVASDWFTGNNNDHSVRIHKLFSSSSEKQ